MTNKPAVEKSRNAPGTPTRNFRIDDTTWTAFGAVAEQLGMTRTQILADYVRYMTGQPGAKLTRLPATPPAESP